jgi:cytochrome c-type biogenesis protein CcmF
VAHFGIVLLVMGITGSSIYQTQAQVVLSRGQSTEFKGYTLAFEDLLDRSTPAKQQFVAVLGLYRDGRRIDTLRPEKNFHWSSEQWVSEVSIHTSYLEDLYVSLAGLEEDGLATFQVLVNPLVIWLWVGGAVALMGAAIAWWPSASDTRRQ